MDDPGCHRPLLRQYPQLETAIARICLGSFPTPVQRVDRLGYDNLWIKRDDLSSSAYGGNKVRKLEFLLADARRKKKKQVITMGGIGTNHGLATAIFCNQLDMSCTLLLFHQPVTEHVKQNLRLFASYNAKMVYHLSLGKTVLAYYLLQRIAHPAAFFIFAGGSNSLGTVGFVNAAFELKDQIDQGQLSAPSVIFCPLGSGGTLAGLSLGVQLAGLTTRVMGVRVTASHLGPLPACTAATVAKLMERTYRFLKKRSPAIPPVALEPPVILHDYFGGGYGVSTRNGSLAARAFREKENIVLEPTYTAKTAAAVMDYCRERDRDDGPVLYWHTYNGVDLSARAQQVDDRDLPKSLRGFIKIGKGL